MIGKRKYRKGRISNRRQQWVLGGVCLRRCLIKQHPKFLCEKLKSQPWLVQEPFFSIQLLFSLNTILFFWDTTGPPGLKIAKPLFFGSFQESNSRIDLNVGCHPKKIYTGFLSHNFWGVTTHVEKSGKRSGARKLMLNFLG